MHIYKYAADAHSPAPCPPHLRPPRLTPALATTRRHPPPHPPVRLTQATHAATPSPFPSRDPSGPTRRRPVSCPLPPKANLFPSTTPRLRTAPRLSARSIATTQADTDTPSPPVPRAAPTRSPSSCAATTHRRRAGPLPRRGRVASSKVGPCLGRTRAGLEQASVEGSRSPARSPPPGMEC